MIQQRFSHCMLFKQPFVSCSYIKIVLVDDFSLKFGKEFLYLLNRSLGKVYCWKFSFLKTSSDHLLGSSSFILAIHLYNGKIFHVLNFPPNKLSTDKKILTMNYSQTTVVNSGEGFIIN